MRRMLPILLVAVTPVLFLQAQEKDAPRTTRSDQEQAVAAIRKRGGQVEFDSNGTPRKVVKVVLRGSGTTDRDLALLEVLTDLRVLDLEGSCKGGNGLTDAGLKHLKGLTRLESLNLEWSGRVTDAGLEHLKELTSLRDLNLRFTRTTEGGVKALQRSLPKTKISR